MNKKIKIIDLLNRIANGEELKFKLKYDDLTYSIKKGNYLRIEELNRDAEWYIDKSWLNEEVEILDEEVKPITEKDLETLGYACGEIKKSIEKGFNKSLNNEPLEDDDKDIPLIPDDELHIIADRDFIPLESAIDYNFKVLKEKINQVIEELNEFRKEGK